MTPTGAPSAAADDDVLGGAGDDGSVGRDLDRRVDGDADARQPWFLVGSGLATALLGGYLATRWPLATYTTSLAVFGLAHVLTELRYVDSRFGARLPRSWWESLAWPLAAVVLLRALALVGAIDLWLLPRAELTLVVVLLVGALPAVLRAHRQAGHAWGVAVVTGGGAVAVAGGLVVAPTTTLMIFALLHNATPLGFLVERAPAGRRLSTLVAGSLLFFGVPALVAAGLPAAFGVVVDVDAQLLPVGRLVDHYGVYLPPALRDDDGAPRYFAAAVTAQLLHYLAVIVWMPRLLRPAEQPTLAWPRWSTFVAGIVVGSVLLFVHFVVDFGQARALYGLVAAVHAWVEWPVLAVGLAVARGRATSALEER